ncbi:hypothetical protein D3C78_1368560 [compost metagenome]
MPVGIRRPGFQAHHVLVLELQLCGILDGDDPLVRIDDLAENVEQRGLAGTSAAADKDVAAARHCELQELEDLRAQRARSQQIGASQHVLAELANR